MSQRLAALTGATGFLGAHVVQALAAAGWRVRVLARRAPSPPGWGAAIPEVVEGDLSNEAALASLVEGADAVVHAAGAIKARDLAAFIAVNRDGAARMAKAALRHAPSARFILISSLAAREPQLSDYAASKRAGEDAVASLIPADKLTIVRPPAIYGPGDRETLTIFKAAALSPVLPIPSAAARLALIHVEDAATAIAELCDGPSGVFALSDASPQGYSWREIFEAAAEATGRRPRLIDAPPWLLPTVARISGLASRLDGRAPILSQGKLAELLHPDWTVSAGERPPNLSPPRYSVQDGFTRTLLWYFSEGWITRPSGAKASH